MTDYALALHGLPLCDAVSVLERDGVLYEVVHYEAKRDIIGAEDWRVVRCAIKNNVAELTVCRFRTEIGD